ncbi:MAG: hypothetical protein AAGJ86_02720, partial [Pseudomonadota bacterium]
MTRRFIWLRRVSFAVIVVLVIAVAAVAWLLGTTSGARFVVRQAVGFAPGQLRVDDVGGTFLSGLELSDLAWVDDDISVDVARLEVKVGSGVLWNWRRVVVERLHIDGVIVSLSTPETVNPAPLTDIIIGALPDIRSPVAVHVWDLQTTNIKILEGADGSPMVIREFSAVGLLDRSTLAVDIALLRLPKAAFSLEGTIGIAGLWRQDWTLDWRLDLPNEVSTGSLIAQGDRESLAIHHRVEQPVVIDTKGTISAPLDQPLIVDLRSTSERIELATLARPLVAEALIVDVRGKVSDWMIGLDGNVQGDPVLQGHWSAGLAGSGVDFRVDEALFEPSAGGVLKAQATVSLSDAWLVDGVLRLDDYALQIPEVVDTQSIAGLITFSITDDGQTADVSVSELAGQLNGFDMAMRGALSRRGDTLSVTDVIATVGDNELQANGSASLTGDLDVEAALDARDLSQLSTLLAGRVTGNVSLAGTRATPELSAALQIRDFMASGLTIDSAEVKADWDSDTADVSVSANWLEIAEQRFTDLNVDLDGLLQNHIFVASLTALDQVTLELAATGSYADETWQGELQRLNVAPNGAFARAELADIQLQAPVGVTASSTTAIVAPFCLVAERQLSLCGELDQSPQAVHADLRLRVEDARLMTQVIAIPWRADGALRLDMTVRGEADNPTVSLALTAPTLSLTDQRTISEEYEPRRIAFNTLSVSADVDNGAVDGQILVVAENLGEVSGNLSIVD